MNKKIIQSARKLSEKVSQLKFKEPITHIYNPLEYAWNAHEQYLNKYANSKKKIIFLGMNPGPWGMAQVGVPFGEVSLIKNYVGIDAKINKPKKEHPKRPVEGFDCKRSEVSGRRLWGFFQETFPNTRDFFKDYFVANYCPLVFMEESSRNFTPDKLPKAECEPLYKACDEHLREVVEILKPELVIGVGKFAETRAKEALEELDVKIDTILHPSPANPHANRGWAELASKKLELLNWRGLGQSN